MNTLETNDQRLKYGEELPKPVFVLVVKIYQHPFNSNSLSCLCNKIYPAMRQRSLQIITRKLD